MAQSPILVTGATGAQGGATVTALLEQGTAVRALVRDPQTKAARSLAAKGVQIVHGDFDDTGSIARAVAGVRGVFSMQLPPFPQDPESEIRSGTTLIHAARAAGVQQFVHTSVARAGDQEHFAGWAEGRWWPDYWTSKSAVNDRVRAAGFPNWTILKPAFMMDNFIPPKVAFMFPSLANGIVETAMTAETRLDLVAADDIGRFAAAAFADPDRFDRQIIDLAGDSLTMDEIAVRLSNVTRREYRARYLTAEQAVAAGNHPGVVQSQQWASVEGYKVDLATTRQWGIRLSNFQAWAKAHAYAFPDA